MNATRDPLTHVYVLDSPGLYEITSTSPTTYFVDSRDPIAPTYMRWRGAGISLTSPMDNAWRDLIMLTASPDVGDEEPLEWTLHTGWIHTYVTTREADHPNGPIYWVSSRVCGQIWRLDEMPAESARARPDAWFPPGRVAVVMAVAVQTAQGWDVIAPGFPGLSAHVGDLSDAANALAAQAATLTGRERTDFLVDVRYVPPPPHEKGQS